MKVLCEPCNRLNSHNPHILEALGERALDVLHAQMLIVRLHVVEDIRRVAEVVEDVLSREQIRRPGRVAEFLLQERVARG